MRSLHATQFEVIKRLKLRCNQPESESKIHNEYPVGIPKFKTVPDRPSASTLYFAGPCFALIAMFVCEIWFILGFLGTKMWKIVITCNWNGTPQLDSLGWPCLWPYSWHQSTNGQQAVSGPAICNLENSRKLGMPWPCLSQSRTYRNSNHPLALNNLFIQQLMGIIKLSPLTDYPWFKKKCSWLAVASL